MLSFPIFYGPANHYQYSQILNINVYFISLILFKMEINSTDIQVNFKHEISLSILYFL